MHEDEEETFYVLEGRGLFVVGDVRRELTRGDLVVVPRGAAHTLAPLPGDPLRMLVLLSPPGLEQFFVEVQRREQDGEELSEDAVTELAATYGTRIVGPPLEL